MQLANSAQLPWSTSNEDLVELFTTIGPVKRAEIQYEPNGRSRGSGVVEFNTAEDAETAIGKSLPSRSSCFTIDDFPQPSSPVTNMVAAPSVSATFATPMSAAMVPRPKLWIPTRPAASHKIRLCKGLKRLRMLESSSTSSIPSVTDGFHAKALANFAFCFLGRLSIRARQLLRWSWQPTLFL